MTGPLGLATLLRTEAPVFLRDHWPARPFVTHGPVERLVGLAPQLASLEAILELQRHTLKATAIRDGGTLSIESVANVDAPTLLAAGFTLLFMGLRSPVLSAWLGSIERDCRLPPTTAIAHCFMCRDRERTGTHNDATNVFAIQLAGTKRWRIAANQHVVDPTVRFDLGTPHPPRDLLQAPSGLPTELPADHEVFDLTPGSVLYIPRGYWHDTQVLDGDSLHLSLAARCPTWADLLYFALRISPALDSPAWREVAPELVADGRFRTELLSQLLTRMPGLFELIADHASTEDDMLRACREIGFY